MTKEKADTPAAAGSSGAAGASSAGLAESLERLEKIVSRLEAEEVDLDEALGLFEEGIGILRSARAQVTEAEVRVQQVLEEAEGDLRFRDLDV